MFLSAISAYSAFQLGLDVMAASWTIQTLRSRTRECSLIRVISEIRGKSASCSWKSSRTHGAFTGLSRNSGIRSNMRTLILSDIHLGSRHCNAELVNEVLDQERYDRLVLNGDTINSLNFRKLKRRHWELLDRFRAIGKERELILIRGNHDHDWDHRPGAKRPTVLSTAHVLPALLEVPMREDYRLDVGGAENRGPLGAGAMVPV